MSATKTSLSHGVVRSPNLATMARRHNAERPPIGLGLSIALFASVTLWIAIGAGAHFAIAQGAHIVNALTA
ncbi:MAG: hypothetical protein JSS35_16230 [Proteobacteria bacterium]|nr:hypothetical protein [Pseudomonadota bacterium]